MAHIVAYLRKKQRKKFLNSKNSIIFANDRNKNCELKTNK